MAYSFPISTSDFLDSLPIKDVSFYPGMPATFSQTGAGETIKHKLGARLWRGELMLGADYHHEAAKAEAMISLLEEPGASFLIHDPRKPFPTSDPDGSILGSSTVLLNQLGSNNRDISLVGLPASYVLTPGDLLGWQYGSNPVRYAVHRIVRGSVASSGGNSGLIEVTPFVQPGVSAGAVVSLIRPPVKAKLALPEYGRGRKIITEGAKLPWVQTRK